MSTYVNFFRAFSQRNVNLTDVLDNLDSDYSLFQRRKGNPYSAFKEHIQDYIDYTETIPMSLMSESSVLLSNAKFWIIYISMKISTEKDKKKALIQLFNESTLYEITDKKMYQKFFIKKIKEVFSYKELINVINSNPKTKKKLKPTAKNSEITKMLTYTLFNPNFFNELPPEEALFEKRGKKYLLKNAEEDKKEESSDEEESVINRKKRNIRQKGNKRPKTVPKKEKKNTKNKLNANNAKLTLQQRINMKKMEISSDEDESDAIETIKKEIDNSSIEEVKPKPKKKITQKKSSITTNRSKSCSRSNKTKKYEDDDEVDSSSEIDISSDESISSPSESSSSPKRANTKKAKTQPEDITMKSIEYDENDLGIDLDLNSILEHEEEDEIAKELMKYDKAKKKSLKNKR